MKIGIKKMSYFLLLASFLGILIFSSMQTTQQNHHWEAPKSADTIKNPLEGNYAATQKGKTLFEKQCAMCHGKEGKGNGTLAPGLNPKPSDLTSKHNQSHTDGALYWKIMTGMSPMPSYENAHKLDHNQCWQLINYIRELDKAAK